MGFDAQWGHCRASDIGAPHQRERWFLALGNSKNVRCKRLRANWEQITSTCNRPPLSMRSSNRGEYPCTNAIITRVDRVTHGLPSKLHGHRIAYDVTSHQFPAFRGQPQHDFEPPRVTDRKDLRRDRVKALGNAVVPQVILPIAQKMYDYLTEAS